MFNYTWLCRYPHPHKFLLDNSNDFKPDFNPLVKKSAITTICTAIKNPHSNTLVDSIHQVIDNIFVTKYIVRKVYGCIDPWMKNLD